MKKIIIFLFIISSFLLLGKKNDDYIIPNEAIRFRVIANSNNSKDIINKTIIKEKIEEEVYKLISNASNIDQVRNIIQNNIDKIDLIMKKYNVSYNISYGTNYFPTKNYKGIIYPAGNYESLVITLGEGLGDNFWCVLFPPLCLIDNAKEDTSEIEYKLLVKELFDKF